MIDKLKWLIDENESNPKIKNLLLEVAKMPEDKQEATLQFIQIVIANQLKK